MLGLMRQIFCVFLCLLNFVPIGVSTSHKFYNLESSWEMSDRLPLRSLCTREFVLQCRRRAIQVSSRLVSVSSDSLPFGTSQHPGRLEIFIGMKKKHIFSFVREKWNQCHLLRINPRLGRTPGMFPGKDFSAESLGWCCFTSRDCQKKIMKCSEKTKCQTKVQNQENTTIRHLTIKWMDAEPIGNSTGLDPYTAVDSHGQAIHLTGLEWYDHVGCVDWRQNFPVSLCGKKKT